MKAPNPNKNVLANLLNYSRTINLFKRYFVTFEHKNPNDQNKIKVLENRVYFFTYGDDNRKDIYYRKHRYQYSYLYPDPHDPNRELRYSYSYVRNYSTRFEKFVKRFDIQFPSEKKEYDSKNDPNKKIKERRGLKWSIDDARDKFGRYVVKRNQAHYTIGEGWLEYKWELPDSASKDAIVKVYDKEVRKVSITEKVPEDDGSYSNRTVYSWQTVDVLRGEYLKYDVLENPKKYGISHKELHKMLLKGLQGIRSSTVSHGGSSWNDFKADLVFAAVIAIIVVIGAGAMIGGTTAGGTGANAALALASATISVNLALSLLETALVLENDGEHSNTSLAIASAREGISPMLEIAQAVMLVNGIQNTIISLQSGTITEAVKTVFNEIIRTKTGIKIDDDFWLRIGQTLNYGARLGLEREEKKNKKRQEEIKSKRMEHEELWKELEKQNDTMSLLMGLETRPAVADWSIYAKEFDFPYERTQGTLSLGNIQATYFKALRPGIYDSSIDKHLNWL